MRVSQIVIAVVSLGFILALGSDNPSLKTTEQLVTVVAHRPGAEREYNELHQRGSKERVNYQRLLSSPDADVRWVSACLLIDLGSVAKDPCVRAYLLSQKDEKDSAMLFLLDSVCQEGTTKSDSLVSELLVKNPKLSALTVHFLLSRKRDDDRHFREFVQKQRSTEVIRILQTTLTTFGSSPRFNGLRQAVDQRLQES